MKIRVVSVGSLRSSPLKALWETYRKRLLWSFDLVEVAASKVGNKTQEAAHILKALPSKSFLIALDEKGENLSTEALATLLEKHQMCGTKDMCFVIGGAEGLGDDLKKKADVILAFGAQTWPHDFVRVLLIEQIYRVQQILNHHPYHRGS